MNKRPTIAGRGPAANDEAALPMAGSEGWKSAHEAALHGLAPRLQSALREVRPELAHRLNAGVLGLTRADLPERREGDFRRLGEGLDL